MFSFKALKRAAGVATLIAPQLSLAQVNILTYHNNNARTGANTNEIILTPANVNQSTFGKLFQYSVDGYVYAQPLYMSGLNIPGQGVHNVIFIATEHNSVYCCDADSNAGANGGVLWQVNLGPSAPCPVANFAFEAIEPEVGITGTPVIDPASQTIYLDVFTVSGANYSHQIHALDITTGAERPFSPVQVSASVPGIGAGSVNGTLSFSALQELQRPALTLAGGILYVGYAGYTDTATADPFHGWIIGFNASNLQQLPNYTFCTTPNGTTSQFGPTAGEAGIWMAGGGLAVDANTNLYFATGDGNFNAYFGGTEYGNSVVKMSTVGGLSVADYFTTFNQAYFRTNDIDVGSGGVMLLPDQPGPYPHLMVNAGKPQRAYLLNRDQMTTDNLHYNNGGSVDNILQTQPLGGPSYDTPAYFNERIYYICRQDAIRSYVVSNATLIPDLPGTFGSRIFPFPGSTPNISANGTNNGVVWTIQNNSGPAVLAAYDAMNLASEIYNSSQAGTRDQLTNAVKFVPPIVANGKVYVAGRYTVAVFGLFGMLGGNLDFASANYTNQQLNGSVPITVNRLGGSTGAVQVNYATVSGGSAIPGQDYISTSGTLSWTSGDTSPKNFNITLLNNPLALTNRTVFLSLSNATGGAYLAAPSNAVLTIVVPPQSAYEVWKISHFGTNATNPAIAGDDADPDHDGIPNILEYAFGSDPNSPDTNLPLTGSILANHFQLQFNRNTSATDLTYTAQSTPALNVIASNLAMYAPGTGWVTIMPGAAISESSPTGSPPDQHVQVTITDPADITSMTQTQRLYELDVQP